MQKLTFIIFMLLAIGKLNAQNTSLDSDKIKTSKNILYVGIGTALLYFPAYISYERSLPANYIGPRFTSFINLGTGIAAHWEGASAF